MKRSKRNNAAPTPDMVEGFVVTMAIVWNSYAVRLDKMLEHYGPEAFHEETYAMLRLVSSSLSPSEHLERLEKHLLEVKGLEPAFVGGVGEAPPTRAEYDLAQSRVDEVMRTMGANPKER
jgi:hypothetical protein